MGRVTLRHADGDIVLDGHLGTLPVDSRGETVTLEAVIYPRPSASQSQRTAYDRLQAFEPDAGRYNTTTGESGRVFFEERLPPSPRVPTLLVRVDPDADVARFPELWALVDGVDDRTRQLGGRARLDVDLLVLSDTGEHATETDLRTDLEMA